MREKNLIDETNRLHETVLYVAADSERKDVVTTLFFAGWILSGLVIIFLLLNGGRDAALLALQAIAIAGSILWLVNCWWKHRLRVRYSPQHKAQARLQAEESR